MDAAIGRRAGTASRGAPVGARPAGPRDRARASHAWLARLALAAAAVSAAGGVVAAGAVRPPEGAGNGPGCKGTVYLTFDTGNMRFAEDIADTLERRRIRATFFLANERTTRADHALSDARAAFWRRLVAAGHVFGSHTHDHVYFRRAPAAPDGAPRVLAKPQFGAHAGVQRAWDPAAVCTEIERVDTRFRELTGQPLSRLWRVPGGRGPRAVFDAASACGWQHVGWTDAGFLGDELPSDRHPNARLLADSLARIGDGDVLMAHLGIWSRKDPWAPMLGPLIDGLLARGLCFDTVDRLADPARVAASR
ncbi:MAG: polysaccharide deacetylase family protein [Lautropia sp.]